MPSGNAPLLDDPRALERALWSAYFAWALSQLAVGNAQHALVGQCIRMHIDLANIIAILTAIRTRREGETDEPALIERGLLSEKLLLELRACDSMEAAFEALVATYFAPGVEKGILTYGQSQSLGVMERFLEAVTIERACRLFRQDLLGMAVPLGFIWRKYSECVNLRLLARGALFRMPANMVRLELVIVYGSSRSCVPTSGRASLSPGSTWDASRTQASCAVPSALRLTARRTGWLSWRKS